MNKKGQMSQLGGLAVGIAMLAILLTVTFLILDQGREQSLDLAAQVTSVNETFAVTPDAFFDLNGRCSPERDASITAVYNGTEGNETNYFPTLNAANYTVDGYRLNVSDDALGLASLGSSINVSYSCTLADYDYNATAVLTNATNEIPGWVSLIVITVIGGLLLGLVLVLRGRRQ